MCGFCFVLRHLDGRELAIKSPPGQVIEPGSVRCVIDEGMPIYRNPDEKGRLFIKFEITFPPNHFTDETHLKILETYFPPRPAFETSAGEHVEEVDLCDLESSSSRGNGSHRGEAYDSDDEGGSRPHMQCTSH